MAKIKKINPEWYPAEKKEIRNGSGQVIDRVPYVVGDIVEITDYRQLVRSGAAVLVDEEGNEIGLPGEKYRCAVCTRELDDLPSFVAHVQAHKRISPAPETSVSTVTPEVAANVAATLAQAPASEPQPVTVSAPKEQSATDQKAEEIKAKRLAALARAREVRAAKAQSGL